MSIGTIISRITGVVRLAVLAAALGIAETRLTDAYNLANTVPNVIYELVLGGIVTSVFVPVFVELRTKETPERAWAVYSAIFNCSLLLLAVICAIAIALAPWIAGFYASRLTGAEAAAQKEVVTFLLRLLLPQVLLYGVYFLAAGLLNANKRFGPPMFTPIVNNLVLIAVLLFFHQAYGLVTLESITTTQLVVIGLGTTASVAPMGLLLLPYLRKMGRWRPTLDLSHPALKKLGPLSLFAAGFVVANQVGFVVIQWLANAQQGGYSSFIAAQTFFLMPIGLFVWSITTALVPAMSEHAVSGTWEGYRERLSTGVRATVFLMLPTTAGLIVLAGPIVRLLLQHGIATAASTALVAGVLRFLALGLVQFSLFQLFVRAFYAAQDTRTPFLINCAVVALNIAFNIPMFAWLQTRGLGAGQAIAYTVGIALQGVILARRGRGMELAPVMRSATRAAAATAAMALLVWASLRLLSGAIPTGPITGQVALVAIPVVIGVASYVGLSYALGVEELAYLRSLAGGRLRRVARGPAEGAQ